MKTRLFYCLIGWSAIVTAPVLWSQSANGVGQTAAINRYKTSKMGQALPALYQQQVNPTQTPRVMAITPTGVKLAPPALAQNGYVLIDAAATGDAKLLLADLKALGLQNGAVYKGVVSGRLPVTSIPLAEKLARLKCARPSYHSHQAGLVTTQGDISQRSDFVRSWHKVNGNGVRVGVLSDSFDKDGTMVAVDKATGDLPSSVLILEDDNASYNIDEGRAMAQIVHDVAPGASIAFHTANGGQANFAQGIVDLANAGCQVIADDIIYFAEPMFADGIIAQAVDTVKNRGIAYFSSAGNYARQSYESAYRAGASRDPSIYLSSHDFDPGPGEDTLLHVTLGSGVSYIILQWDQPYYSASGGAGSASDLDIELRDSTGTTNYLGSYEPNIGGDPIEIIGVAYDGDPLEVTLAIHLYDGPAPGLIKMVWLGDVTLKEYDTQSGSVYGHANARGATATGATFYWNTPPYGVNPPLLNYYSSAGSTPILFDPNGVRIAPEFRAKPEVVGPDGGDTTTYYLPTFYGTSASVVHVAGIAALMRGMRPFSPDQVQQALMATAIDMEAPGFDYDSGYGFVRADRAIEYYFDLNGDQKVDATDFSLLMAKINARSQDPRYDMNGDGKVNIADARFMVLHFSAVPK